MGKKIYLEDVKKMFINCGYIPMFDTFSNTIEKLPAMTKEGYKIETSYNQLQSGYGCKIIDKSNPHSIYNINLWLSNNKKGIKLISTKYKNAKERLLFITEEGYKIFTTWDNMRSSKNYEMVHLKNPYSIENISTFLKLNKVQYKILSTEFIGAREKLVFYCENHGVFNISWNSIQQGKGCYQCWIERVSGENSYLWKGGISTLSDYIRKKGLPSWKKDSFKKYNYQCDISGIHNDVLVIHHVNRNYSDILYETMNILKLQMHQEINKYTEKELQLIEEKCLELHYKYGLGVCLIEKIHNEFHSIYGKTKNTMEQYKTFKNNKIRELGGDIIE